MNILIRLPNWLGDVVMSLPFIERVKEIYPAAAIEVIVKKGLEPVLENIKSVNAIHSFSKAEYKGLQGVYKYGRMLGASKVYDIFFCLPGSFSAAFMAYGTKAKVRIGYKNEMRSLLLTHSYKKPQGLHRVEEYVALINKYVGKNKQPNSIVMPQHNDFLKEKYIVVNINSEAVSRQLPASKAAELITLLQQQFLLPIKLIGGANDVIHVQKVYESLASKNNIEVLAGKTKLAELITVIKNAAFMLSTDSGPAHIAGALKVPVVILFGAGNEKNTGPYHNAKAIVVRNGLLPCEPCVKNTCKLQALPLCLVQLDTQKIIDAIHQLVGEKV